MDGNSTGQAANSSSDFVSATAMRVSDCSANPTRCANYTSKRPNAIARPCAHTYDEFHRMLENPQDESVVRWGNEGDSFVVLEVRIECVWTEQRTHPLNKRTEREIHQAHSTETLQAQQLRQFRTPTEQVRLPQSAPQQRGRRHFTIRHRGTDRAICFCAARR